jgi:hypothetical protein
MDMTAIIQSIIGAAIGALAAYVAIRSDLAALKARMDNVEKSSDQAHSRIDTLLNK